MKARFLKSTTIRDLLGQIEFNLDLYRNQGFDFLENDPSVYFESEIEIDSEILQRITADENEYNEASNCELMMRAMGELSPYLARDERLWVCLTHTILLEYTRNRWKIPDDDEKAIKHIRNHFFAIGARGIERDNAASRLWWMAHLCSRAEGIDMADALECFLYMSDVRASIIERPTTSQSVQVLSAIFNELRESFNSDKSLFERKRFRAFMKNLNLQGGVKLLDALNLDQIKKITQNCI